MKQRDLHWLAGLVEGEGCFTTSQNSRKDGRPYARLSIAMTDRDVMARVSRLLGYALIRRATPYMKRNRQQTMWSVQVVCAPAKAWMQRLYPLLGRRRRARIRQLLREVA